MVKEKSKTYQVFVYGTLMKGGRNSYLLNDENATLIAKNILTKNNNFAMRQYGSNFGKTDFFPGIKFDGNGFVQGDVYEVNLDALNKLDILEDEGKEFSREEITLENDMQVWAYILLRDDLLSLKQDRIKYDEGARIYSWKLSGGAA